MGPFHFSHLGVKVPAQVEVRPRALLRLGLVVVGAVVRVVRAHVSVHDRRRDADHLVALIILVRIDVHEPDSRVLLRPHRGAHSLLILRVSHIVVEWIVGVIWARRGVDRAGRVVERVDVVLVRVVEILVVFLVLRRLSSAAAALRPVVVVGHESDSQTRSGDSHPVRSSGYVRGVVAIAGAGLVGRVRLEPGFDRGVRCGEPVRVHRRGRVRHREADPRAPSSAGVA